MSPIRYSLLLLFVLLISSVLTAVPGQAQTIIHVDVDASASGDGTSWGSAYPALQDAFDQANANPGTDVEIWIAEGTYYPDVDNVDNDGDGSTEHMADSDTSFTLTRDGVAIYGGFEGNESSRSSRDPSANVVSLSGDIGEDDDVLRPNTDSDNDSSTPTQTDHINGTNATHVVLLDGTGSENITSMTILDGVTVTAGKADGTDLKKTGGGLLCNGSGSGKKCSPALTNVTMQGNRAVNGGGLSNQGTSGGVSSPSLTNSVIRWNVAEELGGGMIGNGSDGTSNPSIDQGEFTNNYSGNDGGGIEMVAFGGEISPTITGTRFEDNITEKFGGAFQSSLWLGATANPHFTNCEFVGNGKRDGDDQQGDDTLGGGAISLLSAIPDGQDRSETRATIENSSFSNNSANEGAAVYIAAFDGGFDGSEVTDSEFSQNNAYRAGAIAVGADTTSDDGRASAAELSLSSSSFSSNDADQQGGALVVRANEGGEARPEISDVTFSSNQAGQGGAVDIFANDTDDNGNPAVASPTFTDVKFLGNSATGLSESSGGGLIALTQNGGTANPSVVNSIFSGNSAALDGGAVDIRTRMSQGNPVAEPTFTNVTFTGNEANESGGAISVRREASNGSASPTFTNTILWNNTADADGNGSGTENEIYVSDASAFARYSIIGGGCPSGVSCGTNLRDENPQFAGSNDGAGPDGKFGTNDDDFRLQGPGSGGGASVAIDAGDNSAISKGNDIGGNTRNHDVSGVSDTGNTPNGGPPVDFGAHESLGDPLPVEFTAFEGQIEESDVFLSWRTASEQNNAGFAIQRLTSSGSWKRLGFVESKATGGTTSNPQSYRFRDSNLPFETDSLVYRLKQVDLDGSTSFSDRTVIRRRVADEVKLLAPAPNPVRTQTQVRFALPEDIGSEVELTLYDVMGRQVHTVDAGAEAGRYEQTLDVSGIASGVYILQLTAGGASKTRKLTIVR
ncbi:hypothetical protein BSZ35_18685 [Salinibacter sp. 10B]|uniref:T9SS type A sorting domain-containing protein n=1 Tax=Salinibacter sp. 10B TaxID=1923971 RepID=UPI000D2EBA57|nr:T9SS type A sorting domain-containing protein [Salinibacter sp. 10B]PQJ26951.1 hypothetical protein BSZ35_18685 [Salinibacter sp. 10B]